MPHLHDVTSHTQKMIASTSSEEEDYYDAEEVSPTNMETPENEQNRPRVALDASMINRHTYLGDVEDISYSQPCLIEDESYVLPIIPLTGVVVFPGMMFPLLFSQGCATQKSVAHALTADAPLRGLVAVYDCERVVFNRPNTYVIGCLAEIKQSGTSESGSQSVIALGKHKIQLNFDIEKIIQRSFANDELILTEAVILSQTNLPPLPSALKQGLGYWPTWITKSMDPYHLANLAYQKAKAIVDDDLTDLRFDPKQFSYWLACRLPLDSTTRQKLLEEPHESYRLKKEIELLMQITGIFCKECKKKLADLKDTLTPSEMAPSQLFVNAHGFVHDMMMLKSVVKVKLQGHETTEHSWFPGYAWVLAHCPRCFGHIGWMFKSVERDRDPAVFWGFSRSQITYVQSLSESSTEVDPV